jgi:hypothetical protein
MEILKGDKMIEKLSIFHNVECDFYDMFKNVKVLPIPKVSYTQKFLAQKKQKGVIFMEDMSDQMKILGAFGSLNVFQVE